jgi:hypothetical protein
MAEYLRAPWFAYQIIVGKDPAVRVIRPAGEEWEYEMLVPQSDQQSQVAGRSVSGI